MFLAVEERPGTHRPGWIMTEELRFEHRMSSADALFWRLETDPLMRSAASAVALLERAPDRELRREKLRRAAHAIPRVRQRVVVSPLRCATLVWEMDPYFDLNYHLRWVGAPRDRPLHALQDLAALRLPHTVHVLANRRVQWGRPARGPGGLLRADGDHGAGRVPYDALGDAPEQDVRQSGTAVRPHHDQVRALLAGHLHDHVLRAAVAAHRLR